MKKKWRLMSIMMSIMMVFAMMPMMMGMAYAEGEAEIDKICFDGDSDYDWAHFYSVDGKEGSKTQDDLNITVLGKAGNAVDPADYNISIEHLYWDEAQGKDIYEPAEAPFGIYEDEKEWGFSEYRATVRAKEGGNAIGEAEATFFIVDKYCLNYVFPEITFEDYVLKDSWRMHDRYWFSPGEVTVPKVKAVDGTELEVRKGYEVGFYRRSGSWEDMDNPKVDFKDILVADDEHLVVDGDGNPTIPTEPGAYFVKIEGKDPYYGGDNVLIDIDDVLPIAIDDGRELWSDGDLELNVTPPNGITDADTYRFIVGVRGEDDWETVFADRENEADYFEFDEERGKLILHGDAIFNELGERHLDIYVNIKDAEQNVLAEGFAGAHIRQAKYEYDLFDDHDMLPGWDGWIDKNVRVWVCNAEYPDGQDFDLPIESVKIKSQEPDDEVLSLEEREDGWEYRANKFGNAVIEIKYKDLDESIQSHELNVWVSDTVYNLDMWPVSGEWQKLPGGSIELEADAVKKTAEPDENNPDEWHHEETRENLDITWSLGEGSEEWATLTPDTEDPTKATLKFKNMPEGWEHIEERVEVCVSVADKASDDHDKVRAERWEEFYVNDAYFMIAPALIDSSIDVGESIEITPELRYYEYGKEGYERKNAHFRWYYNPDAIEITDANGKVVGNNEDGTDNYIDSEASYGEQVKFHIKRLRNSNERFEVKVDIQDEGEWKEVEWREYWLDELNYDIRFEEADSGMVFTDGSEKITANVGSYENYDDAVKAGYSLKFEAGFNYDFEAEEWGTQFTPDKEYSVIGNVLTINGTAIDPNEVEQDVFIIAKLMKNGVVIADNNCKVYFKQAWEDYDLEHHRNMLPGWDGWIDKYVRVWVCNSEYPDGQDFDLPVESVTIKSQEPGDEVLSLEKREDGWAYYANEFGSAVLEIKYEDLDESIQSHELNVWVSDTVYNLDMWPESGVYQGLPGTSIELRANARKETAEKRDNGQEGNDYDEWWHHEGTSDGMQYKWDIVNGTEFATITQDSKDPAKATLTFKKMPEGWESIGERIEVKVSVTDSKSEDPSEIRNERWQDFWVNDTYHQIYPATIDSDLDMGKSMTIEPELRFYQLGKDGYETVSDVNFEICDYDPNAIAVDGFTITRKADWDTHFGIRANWKEDGKDEQIDNWYQLNRREYRIHFEYDNSDIYDDETLTVKLNKEELEGLTDELADSNNEDYKIVYTVGKVDDKGENWTSTLPEEDYVADINGITISGQKIKEAELDGVNIKAELIINGERFGGEDYRDDTWCWLELREACPDDNHEWIEATCTEPETCEKCGKKQGEALGHQEEVIPAAEPTCTAKGSTEGKKCSVCGEILEAPKEIAALNHNWNQGVVTTQPTTTAEGVRTYTCNRCSDTKTERIPKLPPVKIAVPAGKTLTYNAKAQTGVAGGTGYTLSGTVSATNAGSYTAKATPKDGYAWSDGSTATKNISWKINKAVAKVGVPAGKTFTYNGKAQTGVAAGSNYTLSGTVKATKAGSYTAKATLKTNANYTYKWSDNTTAAKNVKWTIKKAANPLTIKAKTATVKVATLKKKKQVIAVGKLITFSKKAQGAVTYVKASGNKGITINKKTGAATVKKGLKKGTYKIKVKATAAGNANYNKITRIVTFTIKVK